jgi:hypothetical protein
VSKLPLKYAVVSLYSLVNQRLKCNTGKVCNCLIQFLLTMVLSIEERVFLVHSVFSDALSITVNRTIKSDFEQQLQEAFHIKFH